MDTLINGGNLFFKPLEYMYYNESENKVVIDPND